MPGKVKSRGRERYRSALKELETARAALEKRESSEIDDKLHRYRTVKKAINVFEEKFKRMAEIRQRLKLAGKKQKAKDLEIEMMHIEKDIETLYSRTDSLGKEIIKLSKHHQKD